MSKPARVFDRFVANAARLAARGIYRSVEVDNPEQGWSGYPAILAANHPTGFSDPVLLLGLLGESPRFLAKSTLWKVRPVGWVLDRVGAIPVYRPQDGSTMGNADMFRAAVGVLHDGASLALFPEGKANDAPSLAPLRTGMARITLSARAGGVRELRLVPIGIHFEDKAAIRSRAYVQVGDVLDVDAEIAEVTGYDASSPEDHDAVHALTGEIQRRLRLVAPGFSDDREAHALSFAAGVTLRKSSHPVSYADRQRLAGDLARLPRTDRTSVVEAAEEYEGVLAGPAITDADVVGRAGRRARHLALVLLVLLVLAPFAIVGVILNLMPYLGLRMATRMSYGEMTPSTVRLVASIGAFLIMWFAWAAIAWQMVGARIGLLVFVAAPLYGGIAVYVLDRAVGLWQQWRGRRRVKRLSGSEAAEVTRARSAVVTAVEGSAR